jgi:hypothetical protein
MARKKKSPIEERSRKGVTDGRYNKPLDARAQKKSIDKTLRKLREL